MAEIFPILQRGLCIQVYLANKSHSNFNAKLPFTRNIIIKLYKIKDDKIIFKLKEKKNSLMQGNPL